MKCACGRIRLNTFSTTIFDLEIPSSFYFDIPTPPPDRYLFSVSEAVPGLSTAYSLQYAIATAQPSTGPFSPPDPTRRVWGRERTGGGVGRGTRVIAGNVRHPGTRPGQPAVKGTLNTYAAGSFLSDGTP